MGIDESLGLTVVARNDSSAEVNAMHVEIKQVCCHFVYVCWRRLRSCLNVAFVWIPGVMSSYRDSLLYRFRKSEFRLQQGG